MTDYTKLHTKQLLALLHNLRVGYSREANFQGNYGFPRDTTVSLDVVGAQMEALKAELAKRPHVPNKHEAKAIRQAKAKR